MASTDPKGGQVYLPLPLSCSIDILSERDETVLSDVSDYKAAFEPGMTTLIDEVKHVYEKFLSQFTDYIFVEDKPQKSDVIFIPGNGYPQMAERAANLWKEGYAPYILPSGRYSVLKGKFDGAASQSEVYRGAHQTECEFLTDVLKKNGVPKSAILQEAAATYTYENALFSRKVTDSAGLTVKRAILCSRNFHARRALLYYQLAFPETEIIVCPSITENITRENWHETGKGIDLILGELERCGGQFHKILRDIPTP